MARDRRMWVRKQGLVWRVTAFLTGVGLLLVVLSLFEFLLGTGSPLMLPVLVGSYASVGAILGYYFPEKGWRSGFWLIAFFLLLLVGNSLFVGSEIPWDWRKEIKNLIGDVAIVAAAFVGAALGSFLNRRLNAN